MNNISVVINYCSLEREFLSICIRECLQFSDDIVVSYGSHFYDGTIEDHDHINQEILNNQNIRFVKYEVDATIDLTKQRGVKTRPHAYWHNLARWSGLKSIKRNGWILFLDVDEIPDGKRVKDWIDNSLLDDDATYSLVNYWYFKSPNYRATEWEDSAKVANIKNINEQTIFSDYERDHLQNTAGIKTAKNVLGIDALPLIHHYSWVRSQSVLLKKISSWGHKDQVEDPMGYVNYIFKNNNINETIHNYSYEYVHNKFSIMINTEDVSYPLNTKLIKEQVIQKKIELELSALGKCSDANLNGLKLMLRHKYKESVGYFAEAIESANHNSDYYSNLGGAFIELGHYESAIEIFNMALKMNVKNYEAKFNLGIALFKTGRNLEALKCFESIVPSNFTSDENYYYLGCAYLNNKQYKNALDYLENLIQKKIQDDGLLMNKAICLENL